MTETDPATEHTLHCLGYNVRLKRKELGLRQHDLSEKTGISQKHISLIERGQMNVTVNQMQRLASALSSTVQSLLSESE
uniref:HTH cro/C1-type domain-containing protein n=1 Tax=Acetobacter pasteurianus TaxID=438 RepID=I3W077_ACEPA|nr:helix-turn-helix transcriptional regulator [Acetobacter pasteurianus]AFK89004.1 hypothetical protein [Acetobacter pasteurianus]